MKTLKKVVIEPVYVEFIPSINQMEEGKIYISEEYEVSVHRCLCGCGCGSKTVLPLWEKGWTLIKHDDGKIW